MSTTVQAITEIRNTNQAAINEILASHDGSIDIEVASDLRKLQGDGIWAAILELAARVDHAPKDAADKIGRDFTNLMAG